MFTTSTSLLILSSLASAEVAMWGRCGGEGYTGETNCVAGASCVSQNPWYYQCLQTTGAAPATHSSSTRAATHPASTRATTSTSVANAASTVTRSTAAAVSHAATTLSTVYRSTSTHSSAQSSSTHSSSTHSSAAPAASSAASNDYHTISGGVSGSSTTTRYWDCCKPSCAWGGKSTHVQGAVNSCDIHGNVLSDNNVQSGCVGGSAYMCNDQTPWVVSDTLAYGFAAAAIAGQNQDTMCCSCMKLTFQDQLVGKEMIVQITNTGDDMTGTNFDIALPGGGFGAFTQGCPTEFGNNFSWGQTYGGVSSLSDCSGLPSAMQPGCEFRFDNWFQGADNPHVTFEQVTCPAAIIARSGCSRDDE